MRLARRGPRIAAACLAAGLLAGCAPNAQSSPDPERGQDAAGVDDGPSEAQPDDPASDDQAAGESEHQPDGHADNARPQDDGTNNDSSSEDGDDRPVQRDDGGDTWTFGDGADGSDAVSATELPDEIDAVMDVPDSFEQYSRAEASSAGQRQLTVQGEVTGARDQLLTRIEEGMRAAGWDRIELDDLVADRPILRAEDDDRQLEVTVSVPDGQREGALTISYRWPE